MLTVGHLLREARHKQGITLEEAEKATKIRRKYLASLEGNDFASLPGRAYIAGFIRNYSEYLELDPERALAIFRREYAEHQQPQVLPKGLTTPVNSSRFTLTPRLAVVVASSILLLVFFAYLFVEYRFVAIAPQLSLDSPVEHQITQRSGITVQGWSDPDAQVLINDQPVSLQVDGSFNVDIFLTPGINTITVVSTNKFGKKAILKRTVEYVVP